MQATNRKSAAQHLLWGIPLWTAFATILPICLTQCKNPSLPPKLSLITHLDADLGEHGPPFLGEEAMGAHFVNILTQESFPSTTCILQTWMVREVQGRSCMRRAVQHCFASVYCSLLQTLLPTTPSTFCSLVPARDPQCARRRVQAPLLRHDLDELRRIPVIARSSGIPVINTVWSMRNCREKQNSIIRYSLYVVFAPNSGVYALLALKC